MKPIGFLGVGKLGLAVTVAMGYRGIEVIGCDTNPAVQGYIDDPASFPQVEAGINGMTFEEMLGKYPPRMADVSTMAAECDLIFVAVQTPHQPRFDGTQPLPQDRADFDYTYLCNAIRSLQPHLEARHTVVVISTCLPGTMRREVLPMLDGVCPLIYNPYFIAMQTVIPDFLNPEFILIGADKIEDAQPVKDFYYPPENDTSILEIFCQPRIMSYESAELTKVGYNAMISLKICYANMLMDLCDRIPGANVDDITDTIKLATDRLVSTKYLTAGMGDGGACHPRDAIAMAWLMDQVGLNYNLFDDVMNWREQQARTIANRMLDLRDASGLPLAVWGTSFKANTKMLDGSPALLVANILKGHGREVDLWDPLVSPHNPSPMPQVILIGCRHDWFKSAQFPPGSVVLDPFRYVPEQAGVKVVRMGIGIPGASVWIALAGALRRNGGIVNGVTVEPDPGLALDPPRRDREKVIRIQGQKFLDRISAEELSRRIDEDGKKQ